MLQPDGGTSQKIEGLESIVLKDSTNGDSNETGYYSRAKNWMHDLWHNKAKRGFLEATTGSSFNAIGYWDLDFAAVSLDKGDSVLWPATVTQIPVPPMIWWLKSLIFNAVGTYLLYKGAKRVGEAVAKGELADGVKFKNGNKMLYASLASYGITLAMISGGLIALANGQMNIDEFGRWWNTIGYVNFGSQLGFGVASYDKGREQILDPKSK